MSQPETCYLCDEIVTFCQCSRSVTDKDEALVVLRERLTRGSDLLRETMPGRDTLENGRLRRKVRAFLGGYE